MVRCQSLYGRQGTTAQTRRVERDAALAQTPESAGRRGEEGRRSRSRAGRIVVEADVTLGPLRKSQPSAGHTILICLLLKRGIRIASIAGGGGVR